MLSAEDLQFYLGVFRSLGLTDLLELAKLAEVRNLKAGDVYIHEGSASQRLAYIRKGLMRTYALKENGDDVTMMLRWEGQFVASVDSIVMRRPSRFTYQVLEDTILMEVDYLKAFEIIDANPKLSSLRSNLLLGMLSQAMERIEGFVLLSPEERYQKLVVEKPNIINRVPDKYLATLLGITPVSLSRIRKRIARHNHP